jgi:osmotically-inducible protein OsmY
VKTAALFLAAVPLLGAPAAGQIDLTSAVRDAIQQDPRGSPEALRLERERLLDLQLAQLVNQRLLAEVRGVEGLVVACHDGLVELRGQAADEAQRARATELALTVTGVRGVTNGLLLPGEAPPAPAVILPPVEEFVPEGWSEPFGFATRDGLAGRGLQASSADGIVWLRGEVNIERARTYASIAVQSLEGVRAVHNELVVRTATVEESRRLAVLIQHQFEYDPIVQTIAPMVLVQVNDGIVRLEGNVQYEVQRHRAADLASWQVGVFAVDNRLHVDEDLQLQPARRAPRTIYRSR